MPASLPPGGRRAALARDRRLFRWSEALLGIEWFNHPEHPPAPTFVIGRAISDAWMTHARPDYDSGEFLVTIAWDERRIDPLSCTLLVRNEVDGLPALIRHVRIADLPSDPAPRRSTPRRRRLPASRRQRRPCRAGHVLDGGRTSARLRIQRHKLALVVADPDADGEAQRGELR
jgi:hypothetical protein